LTFISISLVENTGGSNNTHPGTSPDNFEYLITNEISKIGQIGSPSYG